MFLLKYVHARFVALGVIIAAIHCETFASSNTNGAAGQSSGENTGVVVNNSAALVSVEASNKSAPEPASPILPSASATQPKVTQSALPTEAKSNLATDELKPLGKTNGPLSVRPTEKSNVENDRLLGTLDPRSNDVVRVLGALAVVIGLLLLVRTFFRRVGLLAAGGERPSGVMEVLARYPIARGQHLLLLKLARRIVLLHQSGSTMTALSEITDADEVASLLSKLEAGSSERNAMKFRAALDEFAADHEVKSQKSNERAGRNLPRSQTEVIDLTRSKSTGFAALLNSVKGGAR